MKSETGPRVTLKDVASEVGVSIATVSDVLNRKQRTRTSDDTRARIHAAAARLGYVPQRAGRSLRTGFSYHVGLVLSLSNEQRLTSFEFQALDGALRAVQDTHWMVTTVGFRSDEEREAQLDRLIEERIVDGVVLFEPSVDSRCERRIKGRLPFVMIGRSTDPDVYTVDNDNVAAAHETVSHFLRAGHRRIALVAAPLGSTVAVDRRRGYRQALQEAGLPCRPEFVAEAEAYSAACGQACFRRLLAQCPERPTAIVAMDDTLALGVMQAAQQSGLRVPEDVGVIGFNDSSFAPYCEPPLTTVRIFAETLAYEAVAMLIRLITRQVILSRRVLTPAQLIVRRSCGAAHEQVGAPE